MTTNKPINHIGNFTPYPPTIVIDNREKKPYSFSPGIPTLRKKLLTGDYSIEGYENAIAVERKSLADFVNTVIHSQTNFSEELKRLSKMLCPLIIVEANAEDLWDKNKYKSKIAPESLWKLAMSLSSKWGIPVFYFSNRQLARHSLEVYLCQWWDKEQKKQLRMKATG